MNPDFFIYAKTSQTLPHFAFSPAIYLGCREYLGYQIAFFQGNLTANYRQKAADLSLEISPFHFTPNLGQAGLLLMDMDSTAIQIECIDEIAKLAGSGEKVAEITERAMQGELDFEQSLRQRVATLANASESILQTVREKLPLTDGFEMLVEQLQSHGWRLAIASGGFDYFAEDLKARFKLDAVEANQFDIVEGKLTGSVRGKIVDAQHKADTLKLLGERFGIPSSQWVAIGDGANDLPMLACASLGVAFHAKAKVQQQAQVVINFHDLTALLVLLNAKTLFHSLQGE